MYIFHGYIVCYYDNIKLNIKEYFGSFVKILRWRHLFFPFGRFANYGQVAKRATFWNRLG